MTTTATATPTPVEQALTASPRLAQALTAALESVGNNPDLLAQYISRSLEATAQPLPAVTTSSTSTTNMNMQRAREMIAVYSHDHSSGVSTIVFPTGYPVLFALNDLNELSLQSTRKPGVEAGTLKWFRELPQLAIEDDLSQPRTIQIKAVVDSAEMKPRFDQASVLVKEGLGFSDPRIQSVAALLHKLIYHTDLFRGLSVRGSVPEVTLRNTYHQGLMIESSFDLGGFDGVTASGSPVTA